MCYWLIIYIQCLGAILTVLIDMDLFYAGEYIFILINRRWLMRLIWRVGIGIFQFTVALMTIVKLASEKTRSPLRSLLLRQGVIVCLSMTCMLVFYSCRYYSNGGHRCRGWSIGSFGYYEDRWRIWKGMLWVRILITGLHILLTHYNFCKFFGSWFLTCVSVAVCYFITSGFSSDRMFNIR